MFDIISDVVSGIIEAVFDTWYSEQSWWVKILFWTLIVFAVLAVIYFFYPQLFGFPAKR
jgi:hypothetical protein